MKWSSRDVRLVGNGAPLLPPVRSDCSGRRPGARTPGAAVVPLEPDLPVARVAGKSSAATTFPTPWRRAARTTKKSPMCRSSPESPPTNANPAGASRCQIRYPSTSSGREVRGKPARLVEALLIRQRPADLGHVVGVELPEPLDDRHVRLGQRTEERGGSNVTTRRVMRPSRALSSIRPARTPSAAHA